MHPRQTSNILSTAYLPVECGAGNESILGDVSGVLPVRAQCLPFRQIPHTTRLFSDFLSHSPKVQGFYPRSAYFAEWFHDEAHTIRYDAARRALVAAVLERQNHSWGSSPRVFDNIARFRAGASAVVTGQQVGLFGGPAFAIYKALTAMKLAEQATQGGVDAVPIFWLATEDHDLAEINHVSIPAPQATLERLTASTRGTEDAPVGSIRFGAEIQAVIEEAATLLGETEVSAWLRESYRPGETFGSAFARLFARLFADWGLVLVDPLDTELHAIATPIFQAALERAGELDDALLESGKALEHAGYHQQVKVTPSSTLLFAIRNGARTAIHRKTNGASGVFLIGEEKLSQAELLRQIDAEPQHFSASALLRPVMQDVLLPTLAYVGGAAEVAYFAQGEVVYQKLLGRVTPILPRFSATLVEPKAESLRERYRLAFPDLFEGPEPVRERLAAETLPQEAAKSFEDANRGLERSLHSISDALARLDPTLVESAQRAGRKMQYQLGKLHARAARAELRRSEVLARHADLLSNALYPNKTLQERELAGIYFASRYGSELLRSLYQTIHTECLDHQVVTL